MEQTGTPPAQNHEDLRLEADDAFRRDDYPEAIRLYSAALACLKQNAPKDRKGKLHLLTWLALSYQKTKDFVAARGFHEKELRLARKLGDSEKVADALHRLGDTSIELKDDRHAERYLSESLKISRHLGSDRREIPHLLYDLAEIAERRKQYGKAASRFRDWVTVQQERRDAETPRGWYRVGRLAAQRGDNQTAEEYFYTTLIVAQEAGSAMWESYALCGLGRIALDHERYDRAEKLLRQAHYLAEPLQYPPLLSTIYISWGNAVFQKEDFPTACRCYAQTIILDSQSEKWSEVVMEFQNLAAAQLRMKQPEFAALSFGMADNIRAKHQAGYSSQFADNYRARCQKVVSAEVWQQAQEQAGTMSIPEILAYFSGESGSNTSEPA